MQSLAPTALIKMKYVCSSNIVIDAVEQAY